MDLTEAAARAESFLRQYCLDRKFFTSDAVWDEIHSDPDDDEGRYVFLPSRVIVLDGRLSAQFICGRDEDNGIFPSDPKNDARAAECVAALRAAHPDLASVTIDVVLSR